MWNKNVKGNQHDMLVGFEIREEMNRVYYSGSVSHHQLTLIKLLIIPCRRCINCFLSFAALWLHRIR